jgi:AcrR family transcriptional regulator
MVPVSTTVRRTQRERRESTIARLVDAAIDALVELGYPKATVQEICGRAGLSTGALFRHFPSRRELVVAAAEEVAHRQIAAFAERMAAVPEPDRTLATALELLRDASRAPINSAWHELLVAARTDAELRAALQPMFDRYTAAIAEQARSARLADLPELPDDVFINLVFGLIHLFDGEAIARVIRPAPLVDRERIRILVDLLRAVRWPGRPAGRWAARAGRTRSGRRRAADRPL